MATREIQPGELVLKSVAYACAALPIYATGARCSWCFERPDAKLARCSTCKLEYYCGRKCQAVAWKAQHRLECRANASLELIRSRLDLSEAIVMDLLLACRALRRCSSEVAASRTRESALAPSQRSPSSEACVSSDRQDLAGMLAWCTVSSNCEDNVIHSIKLRKMAELAESHGLLPSDSDCEQLLRLIQVGAVNNFCIQDTLLVPVAAAIFPHGALLNHSCRPNCVISYDVSKRQQSVYCVRRY